MCTTKKRGGWKRCGVRPFQTCLSITFPLEQVGVNKSKKLKGLQEKVVIATKARRVRERASSRERARKRDESYIKGSIGEG